jgi:hypothetical protein
LNAVLKSSSYGVRIAPLQSLLGDSRAEAVGVNICQRTQLLNMFQTVLKIRWSVKNSIALTLKNLKFPGKKNAPALNPGTGWAYRL